MDAIAMGCITALATSGQNFSRRLVWFCTTLGLTLLTFILGFSNFAQRLGFDRTGLDMSVIALGACLLIAAAASTQWRAPRVFTPVLRLGQRSYEVYLTHMFVVLGFFATFVRTGKPLSGVPALFIAVIFASGLLGELVARFYSEPMNHLLRRRWREGPEFLGSVIEDRESPAAVKENAGWLPMGTAL